MRIQQPRFPAFELSQPVASVNILFEARHHTLFNQCSPPKFSKLKHRDRCFAFARTGMRTRSIFPLAIANVAAD